MSLLGNIWVKLGLKSDDFNSGVDKAHKRAERFGTAIGKISAKMVLGWAAVTAALTKVMRASVQNYQAQEKANIKLQNALKNTGAAIGTNYQELRQYASELQRVNGFADDATMSAMATLTTFRSVQGDVFKATIAAAQDMAAFLGTDLTSAVQQLGKALESPETGIAMLRRTGVVFTKEMTENIKKLVSEGKQYEAQLLILDEVTKRFGGEAAKQADTAAGQWKRVGMAFSDLSEKIGMASNASRGLASNLASALETADKIISSEALSGWEKFRVLVLGIGQGKAVQKMVDLERATTKMAKNAKAYADKAVEGLNTIEDAEKRLAQEQRGLSKATSDQRKADHQAAIDAIKARIQVLNEEQAKEEEAAEQRRKEAAEAAKKMQEWREQHTGMINELKDEIAAKETLRNMAQDETEIRKLNTEIALLKDKLKTLQDIQQHDYSGVGGKIPTALSGGLPSVTVGIGIDTTPLQHSKDEVDKFIDDFKKQQGLVEDIANGFGNALRNGVIDALDELSTMIGTGDWDATALVKALVSPLADMAIAAGTMVLSTGEAVEALKSALTSLQGEAAVAAGAALIAVGVAAKAGLAALAKNAGGNAGGAQTAYTYAGGYGVAPAMLGQGTGQLEIAGTVTVKGQDLQIALDNYNKNKGR